MQHSLFFENVQQARQAETTILQLHALVNGMITNDGQSQLIEFRFWTETPLSSAQQRNITMRTHPRQWKYNQTEQEKQ